MLTYFDYVEDQKLNKELLIPNPPSSGIISLGILVNNETFKV